MSDNNEIKFIELLAKTGDYCAGLFEVGDKDIKIGVSNTLIALWHIQPTSNIITMFLKQFGTLKIMQMLAESDLKDYTFISSHFSKEEYGMQKTMTLEEVEGYLKDKILEAEDKNKQIGFRA